MIDPAEALRLIMEHARRLPPETVWVEDAAGRVLAGEVTATEDLPPFDNSAMDGYAVRSADLASASEASPVELAERDIIRAGDFPSVSVGPGEAIRIMTGAPVPSGADSVVMVERTRPAAGGRVTILHAPRAGDHIRRAGEDVRRGASLLADGALLRPYEVALLAAQGRVEVAVTRRPRVAVLATGDELAAAGAPLAPGKIRNSNGPALVSALRRRGFEVRDGGIVRDDREAIRGKIRDHLGWADVLLVSGGVSVGDFDFCKAALEEAGVREVFWKVAIKPGKPLFFGVSGDRLVFGLPGNPVSVLVCFDEFVRPALEGLESKSAGHTGFHLAGTVVNDYPKETDRRRYLFCEVTREDGEFLVRIVRPQGSGMIGMACRANALAVHPAGGRPLRKGDVVEFRWLK
ncbi:MAG: gephyrin-like molybdotransferase Glp [Candidatus Coatesbacteria bacterium]